MLRYARPECWYASIEQLGVRESKVTGGHADIIEQFQVGERELENRVWRG